MKPYGYKKRSGTLHGKECKICKPDLDKKEGRSRIRQENKRLINIEVDNIMTDRKEIIKYIPAGTHYDEKGQIDEFLENIQNRKRALIATGEYSDVYILLECFDDICEFVIKTVRTETDEEYGKRLEKNKIAREKAKKTRLKKKEKKTKETEANFKKEKAEYERLKKKFG